MSFVPWNRRQAMMACAAAFVTMGPWLPAVASDDRVLLELVPPGGGAPIRLTRAELEALPQTGFETSTIWTSGTTRFSGPRLADVLALGGLGGQPLIATAENEYSVRIPAEAVGPDTPIVALRLDGRPFDRRELGPLWIVFPYDSGPGFQTEAVYSMSVWQLIRLQSEKG